MSPPREMTPEYVDALRREVRRLRDSDDVKNAKIKALVDRVIALENAQAVAIERALRAAGVERVHVDIGEGGFIAAKVPGDSE